MKSEAVQSSSGEMVQIENLDKDVKSLSWIGKNKEKRSLMLGSSLDKNNPNAPVSPIVEISMDMLAEIESDPKFAPVFDALQKRTADRGPSIQLVQKLKRSAR